VLLCQLFRVRRAIRPSHNDGKDRAQTCSWAVRPMSGFYLGDDAVDRPRRP